MQGAGRHEDRISLGNCRILHMLNDRPVANRCGNRLSRSVRFKSRDQRGVLLRVQYVPRFSLPELTRALQLDGLPVVGVNLQGQPLLTVE